MRLYSTTKLAWSITVTPNVDNIDVMLEFISYESGHDLFVLDSNGEMAHVYVGEDDMTNDDGNLYRNHIIPMDLKQHEGHVIVQ